METLVSVTVTCRCPIVSICFLCFKNYFRTRYWLFSSELLLELVFSALTSAFPDFPVQYFQGRKEVMLTTLTWFGGQNHFLPIAYLVTSGLILLAAVILTVFWCKLGKSGKNMMEWWVQGWRVKKQLKSSWKLLIMVLPSHCFKHTTNPEWEEHWPEQMRDKENS